MRMDISKGIMPELLSSQQPVVVSDAVDGRVLGMNAAARELFGSDDAARRAFKSLDLDARSFDFTVTELEGAGEAVLDSALVREGDKVLRIDSVCPAGYCGHVDCLNKYELASHGQRWGRERLDVSETMAMLLRTAMFVYAADRGFIFEVDPDLECVVDIYSESRTGFSDEIANIRKTDEFGVRTMLDAWESQKPLHGESYVKSEQKGELKEQLYKGMEAWNYVMVPFPVRSDMRCFVCLDGFHRFAERPENLSVLRNIAILAAGELHTERIRGSAVSAANLSRALSRAPENQLQVYLLGGLAIRTGLGIQQEENLSAVQCWTFFIYLLCNRQRVVPVYELAEIIWPDSVIDDPYSLIKNLAFRTRKLFDSISPVPVITAGGGTYGINRALSVWVDAEEFEKQAHRALDSSLPRTQRLEAGKCALEMYRGSFLPNFDAEIWLSAKINYYRVLFNDLLKSHILLLRDTGKTRELLRIVANAANIEELDSEINVLTLEMLLQAKMYRSAKNFYNVIKKQLSPEESRRLSKLMQETI